MTTSINLFRSVLYVPCSNLRAIEKIKMLPTDCIIFDLEDSVLPEQKIQARSTICDILKNRKNEFCDKYIVVRVNGINTVWGVDDLEAIYELNPDAILLPKVESKDDLRYIFENFIEINKSGVNFWAMIETPLSIINLESLAKHKCDLKAFVVGTNDLLETMGLKGSEERKELLYAISKVTMISKAFNIISIDGVFNNFKDKIGLEKECLQGKNFGFDGKTLIHPAQIEIANKVFSPSENEIKEAYEIIECFKINSKEGSGVAVYKGRIIEDLHVRAAKKLISFDSIIKSNLKGDN